MPFIQSRGVYDYYDSTDKSVVGRVLVAMVIMGVGTVKMGFVTGWIRWGTYMAATK